MNENQKIILNAAKIIKKKYLNIQKNSNNALKEIDIGSKSLNEYLISTESDVLLRVNDSRVGRKKNIIDEIIFEVIELIDDPKIKENILNARIRTLKSVFFDNYFCMPDVFDAYPDNKILKYMVWMGLLIWIYIIFQYFYNNLGFWNNSSLILGNIIDIYDIYALENYNNLDKSFQYYFGLVGYYISYFLICLITIILGWFLILVPPLIIISTIFYIPALLYDYYLLRKLIRNYI